MVFLRLQFAMCLTLVFSGCAFFQTDVSISNVDLPLLFASQSETKTIWVVGHGWHSGLVLRPNDVPLELFPEIRNFSDSEFVELGWGDEGFYCAKQITTPLVMRALFMPTPSVMHVAGFDGKVNRVFASSDIIQVSLSNEQFHKLCKFVSSTFERTENGESIPLRPGLYGQSTFYRAKGNYYAPKTCNVWTASALKSAGCQIIPQLAVTADNVVSQAGRFGDVIQKSSHGIKKAALASSPDSSN